MSKHSICVKHIVSLSTVATHPVIYFQIFYFFICNISSLQIEIKPHCWNMFRCKEKCRVYALVQDIWVMGKDWWYLGIEIVVCLKTHNLSCHFSVGLPGTDNLHGWRYQYESFELAHENVYKDVHLNPPLWRGAEVIRRKTGEGFQESSRKVIGGNRFWDGKERIVGDEPIWRTGKRCGV